MVFNLNVCKGNKQNITPCKIFNNNENKKIKISD